MSDPPLIKLVDKERSGELRELTVEEANEILEALDQEFVVEGARDALRILDGPGGTELGSLRWGMRGGPKAGIEKHLARLRNSPEVVKRVSIVTSSLSKKVVEGAFADIKSGKRPTAHFVQLYWLLTSFFSACAEVGAAGYVICQP
jgi:hypothetical protein